MKLLFDQNLSPQLVTRLAVEYPGSTHVTSVGLSTSLDGTVWEFAKAHGFVVVSKDADFHQRSLVLGHPPKVIWVRRGNCTTATVAMLLRSHRNVVLEFVHDDTVGFFTIN